MAQPAQLWRLVILIVSLTMELRTGYVGKHRRRYIGLPAPVTFIPADMVVTLVVSLPVLLFLTVSVLVGSALPQTQTPYSPHIFPLYSVSVAGKVCVTLGCFLKKFKKFNFQNCKSLSISIFTFSLREDVKFTLNHIKIDFYSHFICKVTDGSIKR